MATQVLRLDASMRTQNSYSRKLADRLVSKLSGGDASRVKHRDLAQGVPFVDEAWIAANFTDPSVRTAEQQAVLGQSDTLVKEVRDADVLVLAVPIYNFGVPAAFKAWIDMITRAKETFHYTASGPQGLLADKKAYVIVTSGGTRLNSEIDFVSAWLKHVLGFIGIEDVHLIDGSGLMQDEQEALQRAQRSIELLAA